MKKYTTFLTIAGSDSGGGAGIQADIKTASACGCFGLSVITALTAQNTLGVRGIHTVPAESVRQQAEAVLDDIGADAVKLGMLPTPETIEAVAELIEKYALKNVVLDPVMIATSGDRLISGKAIDRIIGRLLPLVTALTPNLEETEFITGVRIDTQKPETYRRAAEKFFGLGARAVLIKSGHADTLHATDYLYEGEAERVFYYPYEKVETPNTHGTGCTLSSAIACFLAKGLPLERAVEEAERYVHEAIAAGKGYRIGEGHGPVHHFYTWW